MCVRVCGERASFQALLALPLSLLVSRRLPACVCLAVLESVLFFGAQKAQHTLKDTWPALPAATLTSTANENKIVCMCVEDSLSGLKQRWAALQTARCHCRSQCRLQWGNSCFLLSVRRHARPDKRSPHKQLLLPGQTTSQRSAHAYAHLCVCVCIKKYVKCM